MERCHNQTERFGQQSDGVYRGIYTGRYRKLRNNRNSRHAEYQACGQYAEPPGKPDGCNVWQQKIKDVQLPDGWEWADADRETELVVGTAVDATAVYTGEGHGNYETESVVIAITRLACTHANTEVRDAKTVSCGVNGYTGDTYCKDCGILLQRGKQSQR